MTQEADINRFCLFNTTLHNIRVTSVDGHTTIEIPAKGYSAFLTAAELSPEMRAHMLRRSLMPISNPTSTGVFVNA